EVGRTVLAREVVRVRRHPVDAGRVVPRPAQAVLHGAVEVLGRLATEGYVETDRPRYSGGFDLPDLTVGSIGPRGVGRWRRRIHIARSELIVPARAVQVECDCRLRSELTLQPDAVVQQERDGDVRCKAHEA